MNFDDESYKYCKILVKHSQNILVNSFIHLMQTFSDKYTKENKWAVAFARFCNEFQQNKFVLGKKTKNHFVVLKKMVKNWPFFIQIIESMNKNIKV